MEAANRPSKRSRWSRIAPEPVGIPQPPPPPPPPINNFYMFTDQIMIDVVFKQMKLNAADALAFSQTCKRFSRLYQAFTKIRPHLNFENTLCNGLSLGTPLNSFLINYSEPTLLKSCNFNGAYWIPKAIIGSFLVKCTSLEKLCVAETQLTLEEIITHILPCCASITSLSFTLKNTDLVHADRAFSPSQLESLKKLTSVEVVVADGCILSNLLNFLRYCVNLKEIMVFRAPHKIIPDEELVGLVIGPFKHLESLIFLAAESWPISAQNHFLNVQDLSRLKTFWSNVAGLNSSADENRDLISSLCWNVPRRQHNDGLENNFSHHNRPFRFSMLQSLNEPRALLMKPKSTNEMHILPSLKLVKCHYDGETFGAFCDNHKRIEVLKLMFSNKPRREDGTEDPTERATPLAWNSQSWEKLQKLRTLSVDAELIPASDPRGVALAPFPYLAAVFTNCQIQEVEILGPNFQWTIKESELSAIAQCRSLKRLTLSNLRVKNGRFMEEILMQCTRLESLRLCNVGDRICGFFKSLKAKIPLAKNLITFCLFHNYLKHPQLPQLLESLEQCRSLVRVSLVLPQTKWKQDEIEFSNKFFKTCLKLERLVALFGVFNISSDLCQETNIKLKEHFTQQRQAFRCDLQPSNDRNVHSEFNSESLPPVHGDILTQFQSQVAVLPLNYKSALHFE